jgi:hypothetical protein
MYEGNKVQMSNSKADNATVVQISTDVGSMTLIDPVVVDLFSLLIVPDDLLHS